MPGTGVRRLALTVGLAMIGLACPHPSPGAALPLMMIDSSANGSTVTLRRGQCLAISLPGNPTTGFVWELSGGAGEILVQQGEAEYSAASGALGGGGTYRFRFQAEREGTAPLSFSYRRPFEADAPPAGSFAVTVVVSP